MKLNLTISLWRKLRDANARIYELESAVRDMKGYLMANMNYGKGKRNGKSSKKRA
jgi:hypothetical protein